MAIKFQKIIIKNGNKEKLPKLNVAEFGFCKDTEEIYLGSLNDNIEIAKKSHIDEAQKSLAEKIDGLPKVPIVVNDLTTGGEDKTLSAEQGKILNSQFTKIANEKVAFEKLDSNLNTLFNEIYENVEYTFNSGYKNHYGVVTSDSGWKYTDINVIEGEKYKITGQSWLAISLISFFDVNGASVSFYPISEDKSITNYTDFEIVVPESAVKMVCNRYLSREFAIKKRIDILLNENKIPQKIPTNSKTKLTIIGDSLSALDSTQASIKYHDLLVKNDNYIVTNLARGGHGYKRADDGDNAFWQQASKIPNDSDIVFVFGSFNDGGKIVSGEYTIGTSVDNASTSTNTIMECVNKTITNIRAIKNDAIIVVASPTPWSSFHPGGGANKDVAEQLVEAIKTVAHNQCCMFLDLYHESNIWSWNSGWNAIYCTDGVHPNDLGHKRFLYPIIRNCLNKVNPNI